MPGRIPDPRIIDPAALEALRDAATAVGGDGAAATPRSEPTAARGGGSERYEDWSVDDLRRRAAELDVAGRSTMRKAQLIEALRRR